MLFVKDFPVAGDQDIAMLASSGEAAQRFVSLMLAEIASAATAEQMQGFFRAIGARLAKSHPIDNARNMDRLTQHGNMVWDRLHWGSVRFELDDEGIDIFHHGLPEKLEGDADGIWAKVAPFILEGAYDAWFRQMGSGERLRTRISRSQDGHIELRHGI